MVRWSTGKKAQVAPYSGAIFDKVARSGTDSESTAGPKNSTPRLTTPSRLRTSVTRKARSVVKAPAGIEPCKRTPTTSGTGKV